MEAEIILDCTKNRFQFQRSTNAHFFQPLLPGFPNNFSIPKSFNKYLQVESDHVEDDKTATLRDKTGKSWDVKVVVGEDDRHQLKDGWDEFCKYHDLQVGDFLVFNHHGNFIFDVSIFDPPTACERELVMPNSDDDDDDQQAKKTTNACERDLLVIPISDDDDDQQAKTTDCERELLVIPISDDDDDDQQPKLPKTTKSQTRNNGTFTAHNGKAAGMEKMGGKRKQPERNVAFKPTNHPYFRTIVKSHNSASGKMHVPMEFARANGISKRWCEMVVINEKGQSWPMLLRYRKAAGNDSYIGGWRHFQKANGLNIGDPVIFELIDSGEKPVMKFYSCDREFPVFDTRKKMKGGKRVKDCLDCPNEKHSFVSTGHPYCRMVVKPHWLHGVFLPREFAIENGLMKRKCEMVLIDEKRQSWTLPLSHDRNGKVAYISGWRPFHEANGLKTGDPVIFELVDKEKPVMKFYITN